MITRKFGWKPDLPDIRDHLFCKVAYPIITKALPKVVDLRPGCSPVEDQGGTGSCTANALAGCLEYLLLKDKIPFTDLSRLFIYYNERALEGSTTFDNGAVLRDGIKTLAKEGACTEALWPYDETKALVKPIDTCYTEATKRLITSYSRLNTLDEMKHCLAAGFPFVFGFTVYDSFMDDSCMKRGRADMPKPGDKAQGGHAVCCVGYTDTSKRFIIRNSWGPKVHNKGYFTMPYEYLTDRNLSDDFWTIKAGTGL